MTNPLPAQIKLHMFPCCLPPSKILELLGKLSAATNYRHCGSSRLCCCSTSPISKLRLSVACHCPSPHIDLVLLSMMSPWAISGSCSYPADGFCSCCYCQDTGMPRWPIKHAVRDQDSRPLPRLNPLMVPPTACNDLHPRA
jgi:hypothetical protein